MSLREESVPYVRKSFSEKGYGGKFLCLTMGMVIKFKLGNWRIAFGIMRTIKCEGVYSQLDDQKKYHFLMWDFDNVPFIEVFEEIEDVIYGYDLSKAYIINSGKPNHWWVIILKRKTFEEAREIIASCHSVDEEFYKLGVYKRRWCLRIGEKEGRKPFLFEVIPGVTKEDVKVSDIKYFCRYETRASKERTRFISILENA
ncbi:MAG: hypothetical protein DRN92_03100 [Thermoproteota archaeon]|nr:MAG: hypothetical protein DRN92_03100 [Candidatus Korarchaeota archaeon]